MPGAPPSLTPAHSSSAACLDGLRAVGWGSWLNAVTLCRKGCCSSGWGCLARRTAPKGQLRTPGRVQLYLVVVLNSALSQNNSPWRRRPAELPRMGVHAQRCPGREGGLGVELHRTA